MQVAQVVPDLATFAVDDGFAYGSPPGMAVAVGSIVRVPLGNRRVRGYVVGLRDGDAANLREIAGVSGDMSVFDRRLLETLRWAALHYVAPLSVLLGKAGPANLPRRETAAGSWGDVAATGSSPLATTIARGTRIQPAFLAGSAPWADTVAELVAAAASRRHSALIVVPTVAEGEIVFRHLKAAFGDRVVAAWSAMPAAQLTAAWATAASSPGTVVVGTRDVIWWRCLDLGVAVVLDEGRRGMKEPQTPTTHVRDVLRRRGAVERFPVVSLGAVPTTETVAAGVEILAPPGRAWPLTEIVDRSEEPPGSGVLTERARAALRTIGDGRGKGFVLCRSRGEAVRCVRCRVLRLCAVCGTSVGRGDECPRCAAAAGGCPACGSRRFAAAGGSVPRVLEEVSGIVGRRAGAADSGADITVGTERDIPRAVSVDIAIAVDGDGAVFAANYRAAEEALRLLARLAQSVRKGRGHRAIVQTSRPDHPVYEALRNGSALAFLADEMESRRHDGFPPIGELIAVEVQNPPPTAHADLVAVTSTDATLLGPAELGDRRRWLIQGAELRRIKVALRSIIQSWREAKARVRVDVDPIDL